MRILYVTNTRWSADLGSGRVFVQLADEMARLGHTVEKFSLEDAFPELLGKSSASFSPSLLSRLRHAYSDFSARAVSYIRTNSTRFDVIDALESTVPRSKKALTFNGLLVARSVGSVLAYKDFYLEAKKRWPEVSSLKSRTRDLLFVLPRNRIERNTLQSFRHCDLINFCTEEDATHLAQYPGLSHKIVVLPFGLSSAQHLRLAAAAVPAATRLAKRLVAFIGHWDPRKGSRDWPEIVSGVRAKMPDSRFLFLGTGLSSEKVLAGFSPNLRPRIEVIPEFENSRLPELLADATVGAFPSYREGFGFALLEKMAAGLPVVAYDAPGTRQMTGKLSYSAAVFTGDTAKFSDAVLETLALTETNYSSRSRDTRAIASTFRWTDIAARTDDLYRDAMRRRCR